MKIIHLSNTPLSNAPANLVKCQNQYGHKAKLYLYKKWFTTRQHSEGEIWRTTPIDILVSDIEEADVIHFHNYAFQQEIFKVLPDLIDVIKRKPHVIQYHSDRHSVENFEHTLKDSSLRKAVIAQYHVRLYPECEFIVPNVVPIFDKMYMPIQAKYEDDIVTVGYSPSNVTAKSWDNKGWHETKPILEKLERARKIVSQVLYGVAYEECIKQKRWAHIGIDEVMTGSYHLSSLEYASMGAIPIANIDDWTARAMKEIVGEEGILSMPWIIANANTLEAKLLSTIADGPLAVFERGKKARAWMEKFWNPQNHVKLFDRMYASL